MRPGPENERTISPTTKQDLVLGDIRASQRGVNDVHVGINGRNRSKNPGQNLDGEEAHHRGREVKNWRESEKTREGVGQGRRGKPTERNKN